MSQKTKHTIECWGCHTRFDEAEYDTEEKAWVCPNPECGCFCGYGKSNEPSKSKIKQEQK